MAKSVKLQDHLPSTAFVLILVVLIGAFAGAFIYAGIYNIGADAPHSGLVYSTLDNLREHSIARYSKGIAVPPDLNDPKRIAAGAGLYDEMCTACHVGPGLEKSEMSQGLYPQAPELALGNEHTPAQEFWIIKHGVKLTAMPAWGKTHNDDLIWNMVAFIRQLPKMNAQQYRQAVASAPEDHAEMMKDMHGLSGRPHDTAAEPDSHRVQEAGRDTH